MTYSFEKLPVTVIILSQNEELNIKYAIESVIPYFDQIIVIDSYSEDKTIEMVKAYSNNNVLLFENEFLSWAEQRNWAVSNAGIKNDYIFFLDADEMITKEFVYGLKNLLEKDSPDQVYIHFDYIFLNRKITRSHGHPPVRRIFKKEFAKFIPEGAREYAVNATRTASIKERIIHYDRKPLIVYFTKQLKNAQREANFMQSSDTSINSNVPNKIKFKTFVRTRIWNKLPMGITVPIYFFYRYTIKGSFLEGRAGLIYTVSFCFWYYYMIDVFNYELEIKKDWK